MMEKPLGKLLLNAFHWFDESLRLSLQSQGWGKLTQSQSLVMAQITDTGLRISELARRVGISRQAAQKRIAELEAAGLVSTATDPDNASAKIVILTDQGRKNIDAALHCFAQIESALKERIGHQKVTDLRRILEKDWGEPEGKIRQIEPN